MNDDKYWMGRYERVIVSRSTHSLDARSSHSSVHIHPTACAPTLTAKILWTASLCMNGVKWVTRGSAFALRVSRIRLHGSRSQVVGRRDDFLPPCQRKVGDSIDHGVKSDNEWDEEQCWSGHRERMLIATVDAIACRPRHSLFPTSPWANSVSLFYNFLEERMEINRKHRIL